MKDEDIKNLLNIIHEIFDCTVEVLNKHNVKKTFEVDFVVTKLFMFFYANSILNIDKEERKKYIKKRTEMIANEIASASAAILINDGDFTDNFEGVCPCDKCKERREEETFKQTIH